MPYQARAAAFAGRVFASLTLRLILIGLVGVLLFNTYGAFSFKGPLGIGFSFEGWKPKAQRLQLENDAAAKALVASEASIDNLEQRLAVFIADGKRRSEAAERAVEAQRERSAALDAQIARLRSQGATAGEVERCETPASVIEAEGL